MLATRVRYNICDNWLLQLTHPSNLIAAPPVASLLLHDQRDIKG